MVGRGDVVGDGVYHADLTLRYGIRYVWRGRTTSIAGQDAPVDAGVFARMLHAGHPVASARAMVKEAVKVCLGRRGDDRWEMYAANRVCRPHALRDGQPIWEFLRSNPHWGGPGAGATADGIRHALTPRTLEALVGREGVAIVYTHLGKIDDPNCPFGPGTADAFRLLASYQARGDVLVTTTRRLLRYVTVRDCLRYSVRIEGECLRITLDAIGDPVSGERSAAAEEIAGLAFETTWRGPVDIRTGDGEVVGVSAHDWGDGRVMAIPWRQLTFPDV